MLLKLLRVVGLSVLCSAVVQSASTGNTDNTKIYTEAGQFTQGTPSTIPGRSSGLLSNFTSLTGSTLPGDMSIMYPDTSICDILLNSPEPISIDQIPFFCLCSHCKTTMGFKGEKGDTGLTGFTGSPGRRGLTGFTGPPGFNGAPGVKGQKGDQGDKGQPGMIGLSGMKGERGFKGDKGDHGDDGPAGPLGPQGVPGSCLCEVIMGPPGKQGLVGLAGPRGLPGTKGSEGLPGDKGDKGDTGLPGKSGVDGLKGEQGIPGPCNCTDGRHGTDGQKGQKGQQGDKGDTGLKGELGPVGPAGEVGDMGLPGIPGPCSLAMQSAFSACLSSSFPASDRPVPFTKVLYNVQGHFNPTMGVYVAPINGTYVFTFNLAVKDRVLVTGLFHNFYPIFKMTETSNFATCSQRVVLHLSVRDMVWLQVKDSNSNGMYSDVELTSTFTGFLLQPDSCDLTAFRDFSPVKYPTPPFPWNGPSGKP